MVYLESWYVRSVNKSFQLFLFLFLVDLLHIILTVDIETQVARHENLRVYKL